MDRIEAIKNYAKSQEEKEQQKIINEQIKEQQLKNDILKLSDRIQKLIDTANVCRDHGIKFWNDNTSRNYANGHFLTDGWCHILGFEMNKWHPHVITRIGKEGGGYCNFNVFTDGKTVEAEGTDRIRALQHFLDSFDDFETSFYAYIDKIIGNK